MTSAAITKAVIDRKSQEVVLGMIERRISNHINSVTLLNKAAAETQLQNACTCRSAFLEIHSRIAQQQPADLDVHETELENYIIRIDDATASLKQILTELAAGVPHITSTSLKLPQLEIPTFSGNFEDWPSFEDPFKAAVDSNQTLTSAQKLQYLKSSVTGEAGTLIKSFTITNAHYKEAWTLLSSRYNNQREITSSLIKRIIMQPSIKHENAAALQKLLDATEESLRALNVLSRPTDTWDDILVVTIVEKLDVDTKSEWYKSFLGTNPPTFQDLTTFLQSHIRALLARGNHASNASAQQQPVRSLFTSSSSSSLSFSGSGQLFAPSGVASHAEQSSSSFGGSGQYFAPSGAASHAEEPSSSSSAIMQNSTQSQQQSTVRTYATLHAPTQSQILFFEVFILLEKRFLRHPTHHEAHREFMVEYQRLGHMELVTAPAKGPSFYIPHHLALKEGSSPMQSTPRSSLNKFPLVGRSVQDDLISHLFEVHKTDRDLQRILWPYNPQQSIQEFKLKFLLQSLWEVKVDWDDPISEEHQETWRNYQQQLKEHSHLQIPRCIITKKSTSIQLIGFSDASEKAIAAAAHRRVVKAGATIISNLYASRTKVAALDQQSIPKLESSGAVLRVEFIDSILNFLNESIAVHCYTDSRVFLKWLASPSTRWKTYVASRMSMVQVSNSGDQWHHVRSGDNPADLPSRGISVAELLPVPFEMKHPIILPRKCHLNQLIIEHHRIRNLHSGTSLISIRHHIQQHQRCHRVIGETFIQVMGQLPSVRVTHSQPFLHSGVDYADPFQVKAKPDHGHQSNKYWFLIFVYLATKAIHLEAVTSLSTEAIIASHRQLPSHRGTPSDTHCDCNTNFVGGNQELLRYVMQHEATVQQQLTLRGSNFHFTPPGSPLVNSYTLETWTGHFRYNGCRRIVRTVTVRIIIINPTSTPFTFSDITRSIHKFSLLFNN